MLLPGRGRHRSVVSEMSPWNPTSGAPESSRRRSHRAAVVRRPPNQNRSKNRLRLKNHRTEPPTGIRALPKNRNWNRRQFPSKRRLAPRRGSVAPIRRIGSSHFAPAGRPRNSTANWKIAFESPSGGMIPPPTKPPGPIDAPTRETASELRHQTAVRGSLAVSRVIVSTVSLHRLINQPWAKPIRQRQAPAGEVRNNLMTFLANRADC